MNVKLISFTPNALELLVGTKTTRLRGKRAEDMSKEELYDHFAYMLDTIRSPFDFVDYIFEIEGVSKNFTHQLVRTRTGAYQQESSRANEVTEVVNPYSEGPLFERFADGIADAIAHYQELLASGAQLQDARGILPSNMATVIKAKFNLRTMSDMSRVRLCRRTQGEYQNAFRKMRELVLAEHPWAEPLLEVACVATGQCAFPRWAREITSRANTPDIGTGRIYFEYEGPVDADPGPRHNIAKFVSYKCDIYRPWMDLREQQAGLRKVFWAAEVKSSNPVAKDGKSS